jgi:hypothetical protein
MRITGFGLIYVVRSHCSGEQTRERPLEHWRDERRRIRSKSRSADSVIGAVFGTQMTGMLSPRVESAPFEWAGVPKCPFTTLISCPEADGDLGVPPLAVVRPRRPEDLNGPWHQAAIRGPAQNAMFPDATSAGAD